MLGDWPPRNPYPRRNAERDAEMYERVYVARELDRQQAATEYGLTRSRLCEVLTEEHARRHGGYRRRALYRDDTAARNAEIYRRVVERHELTAIQAAVEYGVTRQQRVSQILDAVHVSHYGGKRPRLRR